MTEPGSGAPQFKWHADSVAELVRLHKDGHSFTDIARRLVIDFGGRLTRCSISGKVDRLGLPRRLPERQAKSEKPKKAKRPPRDIIPSFYTRRSRHRTGPIPPAPNCQPCTLLELTNETCRFPIGDPRSAGFVFCGAPAASMLDEQPYCPFHSQLAYRR